MLAREVPMKEIAFKCQRCGKCCRFRGDIQISPMDLVRYCKFFNMSPSTILEQYAVIEKRHLEPTQVFVKDKGDKLHTCIFFEEGAGCTINQVKPPVCYIYPFYEDFFENGMTTVQMTQCVINSMSTEKNKEKIVDLIERASNNRYSLEKGYIIWYISVLAMFTIRLRESSAPESLKQKYIERFFNDFYLNLDISSDGYLDSKLEEWQSITDFT
ncbi:MAG: YkgJ family cysteine cluster protein [Clostridia bacterium]|nr:YkgJ family cysteine cluster protein [Clostridia bacterium]